jgi:hypothetical protein
VSGVSEWDGGLRLGNQTSRIHLGVKGGDGAPMPTSKECRLHAEECLELAKQAAEFYVKNALIELAEDFKKQAEEISKDRSE